MGASRLLVVDAGAAHVAAAQFGLTPGGGLQLRTFARAALNSDPALEAGWTEQVGEGLGGMADRAGGTSASILGVPGHLALTKFIKSPSVDPAKRAKIIQFEASQNIPYPLEEVVWDHLVVADDHMDLEVMLMAAKADAMGALCEAVSAGGFAVQRAVPGCLALRDAIRFNYPEHQASVLLVNVGARSTHLLFEEPGRFFVRTLPLAGNAVTLAVAEELNLEFAQAETLKVQVLAGGSELPAASPARAAVLRAAEHFVARLQLEITRSAVNLRRHATSTPVAEVFVTGGGAAFAALPKLLAEKLKLPVHCFDPLRRVEVAPSASVAAEPENAAALADLVGLAAAAVAKRERSVTLLPPILGAALVERRRRPALLAAAALGAAALLPPIWHYHSRAVAAQADVAAIDAQLRPLRSLQTRNATNLERIEQVRKQVDALHGLAETKSNWINFLTDLQARLGAVEDVWLEKLSVVRGVGDDGAAQHATGVVQPLRLTLSGRLLDRKNPVSKVSSESNLRVRRLLDSFTSSRFITAVENERFDNHQAGILRFDFTLVINPENPL